MWGVQSLGPAGITIRLVAKTKPLEQWRITRVMRERIKAELDREGIEVPAPAPWNLPGGLIIALQLLAGESPAAREGRRSGGASLAFFMPI